MSKERNEACGTQKLREGKKKRYCVDNIDHRGDQ
jgi:hypothetical protein